LARRLGSGGRGARPASLAAAAFGGAEVVAAAEADAAHAAVFGFLAGFSFFEKGGVFVVEGVEFDALDFLADEAFDGADVHHVFGDHEGEGVARRFGATGAADAVDVIFGMLRHVEVNDVADVGDVEAAGGDVGGDEDFVFAVAEALEGLFAFALGAVGMENRDGVVILFEHVPDSVSAIFGAAKNDDRIVFDVVEEGAEEIGFLILGDGVDDVFNGFGRGAAGADFDGLGVPHGPFDKALDLGRHGGGEEGGEALAGAAIDNFADIGQETHVEHAIGFVEDEVFDAVEDDVALLDVIEQATGGGDDDIDAAFEGVVLFAVADAAVNDGDAEVGEAGVIVDGGFDLGGEFAGGFEAEEAGGGAAVLAEFGKDRQGEGGGFAGPGLCAADQVASAQQKGNGAQLNRRGIGVSHRFDALHNVGGKSKITKTHAQS